MGFALSTSWCAFRHKSAQEIIQEIKDLGFNEVELSFDLTQELVKDISSLVEKGSIKVVSLHNYCPIPDNLKRPDALPDCYSLASLDQDERSLAVKWTKRTIETASKLGAYAVVLHCGRVEIKDSTRDLISFLNRGEILSKEALRLKSQIEAAREGRIAFHFSALLKSMEELSAYAIKSGVKLGIENRFYCREIPSFDELGQILTRFRGASIYYWHDSGHAQLHENLGFRRHLDYLERYSGDILGFHLHDIIAGDDHKAPLTGNFDFKLLRPYVKKDAIKTVEAHYPATAKELIVAKAYLEEIYDPS